jgi:hypothetical protein
VFNVYRLVMREIYPQSTLRLKFEAVGSKYFVGEISIILLTLNSLTGCRSKQGAVYITKATATKFLGLVIEGILTWKQHRSGTQ